MSWNLSGRAIEHCNCDSVCPCLSSALTQPGDYERCRGFIGIHVDEGSSDGVDLTDRTVVVVIDAPAAMAEGNWNVGVVVDDGANEEQADLLASIVMGQQGGPMEAFAPLIGTHMGIERAAIEFVSEDGHHTLVAEGAIDAEFADMIHEGMDRPVQMVGAALPFGPPITISPPTKSLITVFGLDLDHGGRHGTTSSINWSG